MIRRCWRAAEQNPLGSPRAPGAHPDAVAEAEAYLAQQAPLFTRLPFDYRIVPISVRLRLLRWTTALMRSSEADRSWPIDRGIDSGAQAPRYGAHRAALIITHDVDSAEERSLIEPIRGLERASGLSSAWGFVPAVSWPADALATALLEEGCEIYCHDIAHNARLPYQSREDMRRQFDGVFAASPWAQGSVRAFRSGQLLMTAQLFDVVAEYFRIDMSIPDAEAGGPYGGIRGCRTVFPFQLRGILEIPLSLPQDALLLHVNGLSADAILDLWRLKLDYIVQMGGVAVLNAHPRWIGREGSAMYSAYARFLTGAAGLPDLVIATPTQVERWVAAAG